MTFNIAGDHEKELQRLKDELAKKERYLKEVDNFNERLTNIEEMLAVIINSIGGIDDRSERRNRDTDNTG